MKKAILFSFLTLFISVTVFSVDADARRFGGGSSFGKSFKQQKSFKPAPKQNVAPQKATPAQGSRAGGFMGILGGLAMGGLLGALFFGGAFEGINMMDILLIAAIGFAIFWFMRRAASARQPQYAHAGQQRTAYEQPGQPSHTGTFSSSSTPASAVKPDIDEVHFLSAARDIFMRMRASWDAKNMDDIKSFCTPEVSQHVASELAELGDKVTTTEVGMLHSDLADSWIESDLEWVAVHFTAMLKEETFDAAGNALESETNQVDEHWIFQHKPNSDDPTWYLAGIQQG